MTNNFLSYAKHFYKIGFNVTCINNYRNDFNLFDQNLYKAPSHEWEKFQYERQDVDHLMSYDWDSSIGLGIVLGFQNTIAIDIDGCVDMDFANWICDFLNIPKHYEWLIKSGSGCGFHLIVTCNDIPDLEPIKDKNDDDEDFGFVDVNAYYAKWSTYSNKANYDRHILDSYFNENFLLTDLFQKIEFRWKNHLVLPPSIHQSGLKYKFMNSTPVNRPINVPFKELLKLKQTICAEKADFSGYDPTKAMQAIEDRLKFEPSKLNRFNNIIFDVETDGFPKSFSLDFRISDNWPRVVQLSWLVQDNWGNIVKRENFVIKTSKEISKESSEIHGITNELALAIGFELREALEKFLIDVSKANRLIAHNLEFDENIIKAELFRLRMNHEIIDQKEKICTMKSSTEYCNILNERGAKFPTLIELYKRLFQKDIISLHNGSTDCMTTLICYDKLRSIGVKLGY